MRCGFGGANGVTWRRVVVFFVVLVVVVGFEAVVGDLVVVVGRAVALGPWFPRAMALPLVVVLVVEATIAEDMMTGK